MANEFKPNWVSPVSDTVRDILDESNMSISTFAEAMGWTLQEAGEFLAGKVVVDDQLALRLAKIFEVSAGFWLQRQKQYNEDKKRLEERDQCPRPQMVEVVLYEDRRGGHVVVVKMNGEEVRGRVPLLNERKSLSDPATLLEVGNLIRELEVLE